MFQSLKFQLLYSIHSHLGYSFYIVFFYIISVQVIYSIFIILALVILANTLQPPSHLTFITDLIKKEVHANIFAFSSYLARDVAIVFQRPCVSMPHAEVIEQGIATYRGRSLISTIVLLLQAFLAKVRPRVIVGQDRQDELAVGNT